MENNSDISLEENKKSSLLKSYVGISTISTSSQLFTEVEGNWFNSYLRYYVSRGNDFMVSTMVAMNSIIGTFFFILWGVVSDNLRTRFGRRLPLILIGFLGTGLLVLFFPLTSNLIVVLLLGGVAIPIISNMIHMGGKVIVADLIPKGKRGRTNLLISITASVGALIIWIPSMLLLPEGDAPYSLNLHRIFIIIAAIGLILGGILSFLFIHEQKYTVPPQNLLKDFISIFDRRKFKENKDFTILFLGSIFVIMSQSAYLPFLLIMMEELEIAITEMFIAIPIVGGSVGLIMWFGSKLIDKIGRKKIIIPALIIAPIGGLILTFLGQSKWGLIGGFTVIMPFSSLVTLGLDTWTQDILPEQARGKFLGIIRVGNAIGKAIGVLLAGILAEELGLMWIFFIGGIVLWISIPIFLKVPETLQKE